MSKLTGPVAVPHDLPANWYGRLTIRQRLVLLTAIFAIPCSILIGYSIWAIAHLADTNIRRGLLYSAQTISAAVDADLRRYISVGEVLARSTSLLAGDLKQFEVEARRATAPLNGVWVIIADRDGRMLINTATAPDLELGYRSADGLASQKRAMETGRASISNIFMGKHTRDWVATVDLPIMKDGVATGVLAVTMKAASMTNLLGQQRLPSDWLVGIMDGNGRYVSRIPQNATRTGQFASVAWRATAGLEGLAEFTSIEGDKVINGNAVSQLSDWTIGVGVKQGPFISAIASTVGMVAIAALLVTGLTLILATLIGYSIAEPLGRLAPEGGRDVDPELRLKPSDPPEIRNLTSRLIAAAQERRRGEDAIRENLERLAEARDRWSAIAEQLRLAARTGRLGTFVWDIQTNVNIWSEEIEELYGLPPGGFGGTYEDWLALVHPEDREAAGRAGSDALASGELHAEWRVLLPNGSIRWIEARGKVLRDEHGIPRQMIGVNIDVTEARHAAHHRELLLRELAHRVKNTLAVVQSIARQTLPKSDRRADDFLNRLHALAAAHDSLTISEWKGARLIELIEGQLSTFVRSFASQVRLLGDDLLMPVSVTPSLALVLHELACNAAKYGSFSVPHGIVEIAWVRDQERLTITWTERGGPPVSEPTLLGFGSRLISRSVQNLNRQFRPDGLICSYSVELREHSAYFAVRDQRPGNVATSQF